MIEKIKEQINILMSRRKLNNSKMAELLGITPQAMSKRNAKENYTIKELVETSDVLGCDLFISFLMRDTGESLTSSTLDNKKPLDQIKNELYFEKELQSMTGISRVDFATDDDYAEAVMSKIQHLIKEKG